MSGLIALAGRTRDSAIEYGALTMAGIGTIWMGVERCPIKYDPPAITTTAAAYSLASDRSQTSVTSALFGSQRFFERFHRPEHPRFHGSLGTSRDLCDLGVRQALIPRKQNGLALLGRQRTQSLLNPFLVFPLLQLPLRRMLCRGGQRHEHVIRILGLVVGFPQIVAAPVCRDRK